MVKNKAMENSFDTPCTAPQVEEEHKLYENLRNWDDEIINQKMEDLGIPNVKLTPKRKYILGMIDSLADIDTKKFFLRNSDFMEIANISKAPFMEAIKYFSKLGIIKRVSGVRGTASEYKFNEKNLKKLPLENQTLNTKKNQTLNGVSPSVLGDSSKYGLGKGSGQKQSVENQPPHTQSHTQSHIQSQLQKQSHLQLQEQLHLQLYSQEQMEGLSKILSDNNTRLIESINTIVQAIVNTKDETIEELKKIYTSIDNNTRVKSEVDTKILDKLDKVSTSIDNTSKSNGIVQPSIDSKVIEEKDKIIEELQGKINKLQEDYTKVVEERNYFKKRFNDSEEFFKKVKAYIPSEFLGNSKNRKESSSKSNGIVQESYLFDSERTYNLKRLKYEIVEPYQRMIININDSEKLAKAREDSFNDLIKFLNVHRDVLDKYDIEDSMNEILKVVSMKERELAQKANTNETSSKSNDRVQSSSIDSSNDSNLQRILANQMAEATAHPTSSKRNEETKATTTSKQEQCHFPTLRENQLSKLKSFMETFKERISKATDKETLEAIEADFQEDGINFFNLNKEITTDDVTPYSEEISKVFQAKEKELAPKADAKTATKATVQEPSKQEATETPKVDIKKLQEETARKLEEFQSSKPSTPKEVEIPKVEQIALRDEEQKQLQELKDNEIIKPLLENFTNVRFTDQGAFDKIVMEVRKVVTSGNYNQKVVQAFLDFSYTTYTFDCNLKDVLKPIDASKQEATEIPKEETKVEEPKQEETVTPSEEYRDEDYWNPTFTDEQAQETLSRLPKANSRYEEEEDQEEVIDDDMPSDKEVASVVGGYDEENDEIF